MAYFDASFLNKPAGQFANFGDPIDLFNDPETARMRKFGVRVALATLAERVAASTGIPFEEVHQALKVATKGSAYLLDCWAGWAGLAALCGTDSACLGTIQ